MLTSTELPVYQSLWAMEDLPTADSPWTLAEQLDHITGAGFAGVAVDLGARQAPAVGDLAPRLDGSGLRSMVLAFVGADDELREAIDYAHRIGADRIILCAKIYGFDPRPLCDTLSRWYEMCGREGLGLQLETHRNTVTNDLRFTTWLLDHLDPRIGISGDLSHFVCANEIPDDPDDTYEPLIATVLARCDSLQGRIASRGQVQLPLGTPAAAGWEQRFRRWWRDGFRLMAQRDSMCTPMFITELGTRPYAITDAAGGELSDRWGDAVTLKRWAEVEFAAAASDYQE